MFPWPQSKDEGEPQARKLRTTVRALRSPRSGAPDGRGDAPQRESNPRQDVDGHRQDAFPLLTLSGGVHARGAPSPALDSPRGGPIRGGRAACALAALTVAGKDGQQAHSAFVATADGTAAALTASLQHEEDLVISARAYIGGDAEGPNETERGFLAWTTVRRSERPLPGDRRGRRGQLVVSFGGGGVCRGA